ALTIDEEGMAKTAERKIAVARRIFEIATDEYGLPAEALLFDALTFPVTTGQEELRDSAVQTIEGIRRIKAELPGALTILGVSNVSFGVSPHARAALNSVFLYHAVQAGLDAAIVNPAHITPYAEIPEQERTLCDDLLYNRDADALPRFIAYYEQHGGERTQEEKVDPTEGMSVDERIHYQILHRRKEGIEALVDSAITTRAATEADPDAPDWRTTPELSQAAVEVLNGVLLPAMKDVGDRFGAGELILPFVLQSAEVMKKAVARLERYLERAEGVPAPGDDASDWKTNSELSRCAVDVLNGVLLPAMKDVGDRFGAGELILPFVLQSAEVMKKAVAHLERYLERTEGYTKGKVVLATVFGDVHDIGKNLVNTILANNGYTVYDLGKQVPLNTIIDKALEVEADAIGLSALLVSTSKQMPLCVQELHRRNLDIPVIVGGAAINRAYGRRILYVGENGHSEPFNPGVFYARDAFEGLELMDQLMDGTKRPALLERIKREAAEAREKEARRAEAQATAPAAAPARSNVAPAPVVTPPFWGPRVLDRVAVEDVARCLDFNALYRGRWGGVAHGAEYDRLVAEQFEPRLERMLREARQRRWLHPRAVYGYFPARVEGDDLLVLDPTEARDGRTPYAPTNRVLERFTFPRQSGGERLCLADYFATADGQPTAVAFQVVTMGDRASEQVAAMQAAGEYTDAYFLHGLSVQMAEAMADYANARIQAELGFTGEQGRRYSWGYAAIPELADHERVFRLLGVPEAIGVTLTESYQLVPEQSTAAIVVPHPDAVYFAVRA
ncbi:MAG TPA: B12-binding domain-containing protein, partial [Ktedonobacterales bacterium]|nr:B12-binding domain-containing protein [Ktedonobacterales bacterium]